MWFAAKKNPIKFEQDWTFGSRDIGRLAKIQATHWHNSNDIDGTDEDSDDDATKNEEKIFQ